MFKKIIYMGLLFVMAAVLLCACTVSDSLNIDGISDNASEEVETSSFEASETESVASPISSATVSSKTASSKVNSGEEVGSGVTSGSSENRQPTPNIIVEPAMFRFDSWKDDGSVSVNIKSHGYKTFEALTNRGEEVELSNYTVTGTDENTVISLKEEYLRTLSNETHSLVGSFSESLIGYFGFTLDMNAREFSYSGVDHTSFKKATYDGKEINPSHYTAVTTKEKIRITFKDNYLKTVTNDEGLFELYFMQKSIVFLTLEVKA